MNNFIRNLTGQVFNQLTVLREIGKDGKTGHTTWLCLCKCGTEKVISRKLLHKNGIKSCGCLKTKGGMSRRIDLTGYIFGHLKVIKFIEVNDTHHTCWLCTCACGSETVISSELLKKGKQDCGCLRNVHWRKPAGESGLHAVYLAYILSAKKRDMEFSLTKDQFKHITQQNCHYCDEIPKNTHKLHDNKSRHGDYIYNGIDRIDSDLGYQIDNCVPCCRKCNVAKSDQKLGEFLIWIEKLYKRQFLRKLETIL